jgi:hypothetical protein
VVQVLLFSSDPALTAAQIIDYYSLRFQIEFNFHDAKQYWGLVDFMNVSLQAVNNAANLAFFMVNVSQILLKPYRQHDPQFSVLDLKAQFRARPFLHIPDTVVSTDATDYGSSLIPVRLHPLTSHCLLVGESHLNSLLYCFLVAILIDPCPFYSLSKVTTFTLFYRGFDLFNWLICSVYGC